jgi:uncharacterized protein YjbJ (UPF0337 family)
MSPTNEIIGAWRYKMKLSTRNQAKGMFRVVKGTVKEFAGRISSNTMLGIKGKFERFTGNVQRNFGKAQGLCGF